MTLRRGHWKFKEEALDRTLWKTRFGRGYGPVLRQTTEWMKKKLATFRRNLLLPWKWRQKVPPKSRDIPPNATPLYPGRQQYSDFILYFFPELRYSGIPGRCCKRNCLEYTEKILNLLRVGIVVQSHVSSHVMKQILSHLVVVCADMISAWPWPYHVIAGHTEESRVHPRAIRLRILKSFKDELVYKTRRVNIKISLFRFRPLLLPPF